jgi:peptide/nickel transport system substrate-binding protein
MALVLATMVAACGGSEGQSGVASSGGAGSSKQYAELRWGDLPFSGVIDWQKNASIEAVEAQSLAVQDLVETEPDGRLKPGLASSVEQPNPTTYLYNIRPGVKFSDGHPLTVADVIYSLDQNMAKESATQTLWKDVASVSARGNSAVVVKLKRPSAVWPQNLAASGQVYEKAAAEKAGKALGAPGHMLIGTGPWKIDSYVPEASVQLSRNPYWSGPPQPAAKVTITMFKSEATEALALRSGAIDGASFYLSPKLFVNIPGVHGLSQEPRVDGEYLTMNTGLAPFNDLHVRRAIAYATDVKGIISALFPPGYASEEVAITPPATFADFDKGQVSQMFNALPKYEYDVAAAKRELAKSAYPHGFTTEIQVDANVSNVRASAEILSASLAKIGIEAKIHEIEPAEQSDMFGSKVKLYILLVAPWDGDPDGTLSYFLPESEIRPPGGGGNFADYRNAEVNKLIVAEESALNPTKRLQLIGKLLRLVGSEVPYLPLYATGELAILSNKYTYVSQYSAFTSWYTPWAMNVKLAG